MKKTLSAITLIILVLIMVLQTNLSIFASTTPTTYTNGAGIEDNTQYYIYNTYKTATTRQDNFMYSVSYSATDVSDVRTNYRPITGDSTHWDDQRYKWRVHKQTDGTYLIESINEKYLRVTTDGQVIIHHNLGNDSLKFEISRADNNEHQGLYVIKHGDMYLTKTGTSLTLVDSPTSYSYWTFMAVDKGDAEYYGYQDGEDFNTTDNNTSIEEYYSSWGYTDYIYDDGTSSETTLRYMTYNDITVLSGYGEAGAIVTDPNGTTDSMIMADYELTSGYTQQYINDLNSNDLAKSRCIIFASSHSGDEAVGNDGSTYNLVKETYKKGAHFVLGFKTDMVDNLINNWVSYFLHSLNEYNTIEEAIQYACNITRLYDTVNGVRVYDEYIYFCGDANQYIYYGS